MLLTPSADAYRRPRLMKASQKGKRIAPKIQIPSDLRSFSAKYPLGVQLDGAPDEKSAILDHIDSNDDDDWAHILATWDNPAVAIPLSAETGCRRHRLIQVFGDGSRPNRMVSLLYAQYRAANGRWKLGRLEAVDFFDCSSQPGIEVAKAHLRKCYEYTDPNIRDRLVSIGSISGQSVLFISDDQDALGNLKAIAASEGLGVLTMRENIAMNTNELAKQLEEHGPNLAAVILLETDAQKKPLTWVADIVAATLTVAVERVDQADDFEVCSALLLGDESSRPPKYEIEMPTCSRCQPAVAVFIKERELNVGTYASADGELCICEGNGFQNNSIKLRVALHLHDLDELMLIGYQDNFDQIIGSLAHTRVVHLGSASEPKSAAKSADLAIVVVGSKMGHSDSEPYELALANEGVRQLSTDGSQMSSVVACLIDDAVDSNPALRKK